MKEKDALITHPISDRNSTFLALNELIDRLVTNTVRFLLFHAG
ncbi:hypothetical protein PSYJA_08223 [Pseudomonas syringae pv. japonica str. M301072]|uniref:Uncharacterized protein n=1 Tax=Pseudomonas syringae pv. japonica str. M301072 TaxID=629262 RepID=F3FFG6_PSESX|nr:hypothetical protein PSYJA_08223 [Pseudomonas syringae pv. japonica str. M301072]